MSHELKGEQFELAQLMRDISEENYCAQWLMGLEYTLWNIINSDDHEFGLGIVSDSDVAELKRLSEACGGWIFWQWANKDAGETHDGETFVPMGLWKKHVDERKSRGGERYGVRNINPLTGLEMRS